MAERQTYVIVGANTAGGAAAETLRREGFEGRVVLIGAEPDRPYERPPLSKEYLRGEMEKPKLYMKPEEFYAKHEIELVLGTVVTAVDPGAHEVTLDGGETLRYDRLLLATGGCVRRLPVEGADLDGVYYLRDVADSERIAAELQEGRRVTVIGGGFIGSEVAASAREKGLEVTLIEMEEAPLARVLGAQIGRAYADLHRDHGVDVMLGAKVERLQGDGRVRRAVTTAGDVECDFAVAGVGIEPAVGLAEAAGIAVENGIVVDEHCRTSAPDVYAAGDAANWKSPLLGKRLRVEHWVNARSQGASAAKNMIGKDDVYDPVPWFWSDQYDTSAQYVGHATEWDEIAVRGSVEDRRFSAWYLKGGVVRGVFVLGAPDDVRPAQNIVRSQKPVDPAALADEGTDLQELA